MFPLGNTEVATLRFGHWEGEEQDRKMHEAKDEAFINRGATQNAFKLVGQMNASCGGGS
jgi:hypothetical protein